MLKRFLCLVLSFIKRVSSYIESSEFCCFTQHYFSCASIVLSFSVPWIHHHLSILLLMDTRCVSVFFALRPLQSFLVICSQCHYKPSWISHLVDVFKILLRKVLRNWGAKYKGLKSSTWLKFSNMKLFQKVVLICTPTSSVRCLANPHPFTVILSFCLFEGVK